MWPRIIRLLRPSPTLIWDQPVPEWGHGEGGKEEEEGNMRGKRIRFLSGTSRGLNGDTGEQEGKRERGRGGGRKEDKTLIWDQPWLTSA